MASLLDNFSYVQSQTLAQALERQFAEHEQEKARLERKLNELQQHILILVVELNQAISGQYHETYNMINKHAETIATRRQ